MLWSATVGIVIFIVFAGSVKGILAFSFCAIVAFVFGRNLLDGENELDFTRYFTSKGLGLTIDRETSSVKTKPFPRGLKTCRHALIRNILRDFVISWYENVAIGGDFILETRSLLEEATVSLYDKLSRTSVSSHTEKLCILLHSHLSAAQTAKILMPKNHKNFVESYRSLQEKTRTYENDELDYLRNVIDLLLYKLVAPTTLGCNTGRFILREILAFKLLLPLVDTISDPDFVNTSIINIFEESKDENPLTTLLDINEALKSNLKVSTSFMEYLDQNLELNDSNNSTKSAQLEPATKYRFKDATVVEKDHSEIVELSMEADSEENDSTSNLVKPVDTTVPCPKTMDKTSESTVHKKPKLTTKELSHSSVINGLVRVKNDLFKPSKDKGQNSKHNVVSSVKIHSSGTIFARQLRKIQSFPVPKQNVEANLGESGVILSGNDESLDLSKCGENIGSCSQGRSASLGYDDNNLNGDNIDSSQSIPISGRVEQESVSSYEEIDIYENSPKANVHFSDHGSLINDSKTGKILSNVIPTSSRQHTTSFSSTDEWDSDVFENPDDGLFFDAGGDFQDSDVITLNSRQTEDDLVSRADFAIHNVPNPCSMINIPSTELVMDHSFESYIRRHTVYVIVVSLYF